MTPGEMLSRMTSAELAEQIAFDRLDQEDAKRAELDARAAARADTRSRRKT